MAIALVNRTLWKARSPLGSLDSMPLGVRGIKCHYTGGRVDPDILSDHALCLKTIRQIQNHHMDGNRWMDIGYSFCVCPHRKVMVGRGLRNLPAANGSGLNSDHYAVLALVGSSGLTKPNDLMLHGLVDAIEYIRKIGPAGTQVKGHRDGYATSCPGSTLYKWIQEGAGRPDDDGPSKDPAFPGRLLRYPPMTSGADVRTWQKEAKAKGYSITVDGHYGPASRLVCLAIQRKEGIDVDGVVGPDTWRVTH